MTAASYEVGRLRAALADRSRPALGTWLKIPATEVVELMALAGFDFVVIDLEHSPVGLETASQLIATARHLGLPPVVRVPSLAGGLVPRVLDAGAEGVMLPHVDTVEEARAAVRAVHFPPLGTRGVGSTSRAGSWGLRPMVDYLTEGREGVVLIAQVESAEGVRNAGAVAAVEGVDALLVGAADLSVSEGKTPEHPDVAGLVASVVDQARTADVPVGNAGGAGADAVGAALRAGFTFTMLSNDATMLGLAARNAVQAGRAVPLP